MGKNLYISDLHFGHKNILRFDNRPYNSVEEMEEQLILNWNSVVSKDDTVYILGDFCWGKEKDWLRLLPLLKGKKVLISGNHDILKNRMTGQLKAEFEDIKDYKEIYDEGRKVIMCHYPILAYKHSYDDNTFMLHGHVHNLTTESKWIREFVEELRASRVAGFDNRGQIINVGCMMPYMNYIPRTLDYLIEKLDNGEIYYA